jgi:transcriptional regulator with XRE-family HTH domain
MIIDVERYNLLLANKCLSVKEFSKLSGVSEVTLSRIKNESQQARPQTLGKIAKALGINVETLIKNDYENKGV